MKLLPQRRRNRTKPPVAIDCISQLDAGFGDVFCEALVAVDLDLTVLIDLKHATGGDLGGLAAIVGAIGERRQAGGHVAVMTASTRWRATLRRAGIPDDWVVADGAAAARRRIILSRASHPYPRKRLPASTQS
jgi:hypothetical protein